MRAKLKVDVLCGTQAYRLEAGVEVEVRQFGNSYVIVNPVRLTCLVSECDLEFISADRVFRHAMKQSAEYVLVWHHEECTVSPADELDLVWRKRRIESIEKALREKGVKIPTRPEHYKDSQ